MKFTQKQKQVIQKEIDREIAKKGFKLITNDNFYKIITCEKEKIITSGICKDEIIVKTIIKEDKKRNILKDEYTEIVKMNLRKIIKIVD